MKSRILLCCLLLFGGRFLYAGDNISIGYSDVVLDNRNIAYRFGSECVAALAIKKEKVLAVCKNRSLDTKNNYGLRLVVFGRLDEPNFFSDGLLDVGSVNIHYLESKGKSFPRIVVLDAFSESAAGLYVYAENGVGMRLLGTITEYRKEDFSKSEYGFVSAIDIVKFIPEKDGLRVVFEDDVYKEAISPSGKYMLKLSARKGDSRFFLWGKR